MSNKFSIFDEPSENQVFYGKPVKCPLCHTCVNFMPNGSLSICDFYEDQHIVVNECDEYIKNE